VTLLKRIGLAAGLFFFLLTGCDLTLQDRTGALPDSPETGAMPVDKPRTDLNSNKVSHAESFRFVVMGDSRGDWLDAINEGTLRKLLSQIKTVQPQPSFVLFTGDQVKGSNVDKELAEWKSIVDDYYPMHMYYPSLGNHEDDEKLFSKHFSHLPDEQLPGYRRSVYSFDYQDARFIILNSNRMDEKKRYIIDEKQREFTKQRLESSSKAYDFVMFHVPAYPASAHYGDSLDENAAERDAFWSVLDRYKVTAAFVGHEHNYNRRLVDRTFHHTFGQGIYQLTVGGAGAPLYSSVKDKKNVQVGPKAVYHYMIVDVDAAEARFAVYDTENRLIDSFAVPANRK
jgi:3',5'-cyclic-AMP phosphodiesterase